MEARALLRVARTAALVAAAGFALQTGLFLLATTGLLGTAPEFVDTSAAQEVDYATYYASLFNHQHEIVWNVAIREAIGPVAWVGVGILAVVTAVVVGGTPARVAALVVCLGSSLAGLADLVFGTLVGFWRYGGWGTDVPADMIAAGRSYEGVKTVSTYLQYDGFVVLAIGLVVLAALPGWDSVLRVLLRLTALALVAFVVLDWVWPLWNGSQLPRDLVALSLGVALAPALVIVWAGNLRRRAGA
jgi:hypothetical protein